MAVPTRTEAVCLLLGLSPTPRLVRHVTAVAEISSFLAHRLGARGTALDRRLVETAALLHDVDKALPRTHPLVRLGHGHAGARWLAEQGHPELSRAVAAHPVMRLTEPCADEWLEHAPLEDRLLAYADKRATGRMQSLDERFARWYERHPAYGDSLRIAHERARRLEAVICDAAGVAPGDVERLRWVDEAIERAVARGVLDAALVPA
jgi:putative nucleotidyltransferase with HDIG domain